MTPLDSSAQRSAGPPSTFRCGWWLIRLTVALRRIGFGPTLVLVRRVTRDRRSALRDHAYAVRTAERVAVVAALLPGRVRCLEQSLTLFVLLRQAGYEATLRIGVQPNRFRAHAWVEHDGTPVLEGDRLDGFLSFAPIAS
jgi:Transglutaminase-like superfamily